MDLSITCSLVLYDPRLAAPPIIDFGNFYHLNLYFFTKKAPNHAALVDSGAIPLAGLEAITAVLRTDRDRTHSSPASHPAVCSLLLARQLLCPSYRSIPLTETLSAPPIASLDEARSEIIGAAVAAYEFLCLRLGHGLFPWRTHRLGVYRVSSWCVPISRVHFSLSFSRIGWGRMFALLRRRSERWQAMRRRTGVNSPTGFHGEPERCV
jgi:hypothetical protein